MYYFYVEVEDLMQSNRSENSDSLHILHFALRAGIRNHATNFQISFKCKDKLSSAIRAEPFLCSTFRVDVSISDAVYISRALIMTCGD